MFRPSIEEVTAGIYCIRRLSYLNCFYLVKDGDDVYFIDAGMRSDGFDVRYAMDRLGISFDQVRGLFLTHWHGDHSAGAAYIQKNSKAQIVAGLGERPWLSEMPPLSWWKKILNPLLPEWGPFIVIRGHLGLSVPQLSEGVNWVDKSSTYFGRFRILPTAGHSPGHLSILDEKTGTLFCGDALACVQNEIKQMARFVTPDQEEARRSALKLSQENWSHLCPGHRRPLSGVSAQDRRALQQSLESQREWPLWG